MSNRNLFLIALLLVAAALRVSGILPLNFSPVAAIALFGGAMFGNRIAAFAAPLGIMFLSDILIGFHDTMWAVYLCLFAVVLIGRLISGRQGIMFPLVGAVAGSVIFFLVTNAAVWMNGGLYSPGLSGLFESYAAGLPFFRNSLMGDVFFTIALFGTYELTRRQVPVLVRA
jgi:hypothetical protein